MSFTQSNSIPDSLRQIKSESYTKSTLIIQAYTEYFLYLCFFSRSLHSMIERTLEETFGSKSILQ